MPLKISERNSAGPVRPDFRANFFTDKTKILGAAKMMVRMDRGRFPELQRKRMDSSVPKRWRIKLHLCSKYEWFSVNCCRNLNFLCVAIVHKLRIGLHFSCVIWLSDLNFLSFLFHITIVIRHSKFKILGKLKIPCPTAHGRNFWMASKRNWPISQRLSQFHIHQNNESRP